MASPARDALELIGGVIAARARPVGVGSGWAHRIHDDEHGNAAQIANRLSAAARACAEITADLVTRLARDRERDPGDVWREIVANLHTTEGVPNE